MLSAQNASQQAASATNTQAALQANKARFFFQLVGWDPPPWTGPMLILFRKENWRRSTRFTCTKKPRFVDIVATRCPRLTLYKLKLRLKTLLDKKRVMQARLGAASKNSSTFITLEEGFSQFGQDLNKLQVGRVRNFESQSVTDALQQFVEINATAFSKILKKV